MTVENVREKSTNNKHFFFTVHGLRHGGWTFWSHMCTCVFRLFLHCQNTFSCNPLFHTSSWIYGRFLHSYSSLSQSTLLLFQFLSLPLAPEWGKSIKFHMQFRMRTPSRRISPWNGREICKVCVVQGGRRSFLGYFALSQPAHLIFSLCQVSPSLKQPNFWFSFMQSTLLSMLRCPILVPASPTWPWWVGSKI